MGREKRGMLMYHLEAALLCCLAIWVCAMGSWSFLHNLDDDDHFPRKIHKMDSVCINRCFSTKIQNLSNSILANLQLKRIFGSGLQWRKLLIDQIGEKNKRQTDTETISKENISCFL